MSSEPSIPFEGADGPEAGKSNGGSADATKQAQNDSKDNGVGSMGSTELANMALLITEVKETNRLLKTLIAGKSPEHLPDKFQTQKESQDFQENKKYFEPYNEDELKQITLDHILSVEKATGFREYFLSWIKPGHLDDKLADEEPYRDLVIYRSEIVTRGRQEASLIVIGRESTNSLLARKHQRRQFPWQKINKSTSEPTLAATEVAELVKDQWPLEIAKPDWNYKTKNHGTKNFISWGGGMSMREDVPGFNNSLDLYCNNDGDWKSEFIRDGPRRYHVRINKLLKEPRLITLGGHISR
ncbi:hypothetical protein L207DRAFT_240127 [Hyaloscypha variabilis F]|uniref:Uncharacterized protein n=1 Tax=Hyaloscypha variabilis (strain UAMH 11265 / GT02V1 / F) TaxID=1149755 RepID=A0A2J6QSU9_HYAVF|nr:hypothetical protein L207DRAFT_240127 [Hyaloscypha variabilis F]